MLLAGLVQHYGTRQKKRERLRHHLVQRLRAQAAAHHQQAERPFAACIALLGPGHAGDLPPHRVAGPLGLFQGVGKRHHDLVRDAGQHPVGQPGDRVLFMQRERPREQRCHHAAREGDIAAQTEHDVGLQPQQVPAAFPEGKQQVCGQQEFLQQALAARGARADPCRAVPVRRHQALFHAAARAHPNHFPAGGAHLFGDRQSREDVAAGAACDDEQGAAHACSPRASWRFSQSMRSRIASATKFASKPEPP